MSNNQALKDISKYVVKFDDIPYVRESRERVLTGFKDLDYFLKGIEPGITELVGDTNTGKSLLTSSFIDKAIQQNYSVAVFAGEHTLSKYKMIVMQQNAKKGEFKLVPFVDKYRIYDGKEETNIADWYVNDECEKRVNLKYKDKLFLYDVRKTERDVDTICEFIEYNYTQNKVRFFILDNLMEIENNNENQFQEQTSIATKLRNIAIKYQLFIILVMHTNKTSGTDGFRLTLKNAFGSSNITNKGYNVLFIYRKDQIITFNKNDKVLDRFKRDCLKNGFDFEKCDSFIEIAKTKGNGNGVIGLMYDADNKIFRQAEKVSKTEADKLYKIYEQQTMEQSTSLDWDSANNVSGEKLIPIDDDDLPF